MPLLQGVLYIYVGVTGKRKMTFMKKNAKVEEGKINTLIKYNILNIFCQ